MQEQGLLYQGYPSLEEIKAANGWPSEERFCKGPVAVAECVQQIPCNPCEGACPRGAIRVGKPIVNTPKIDYEACIGCGVCVAGCSGLAIFIIDKSFSETEATVSFPFEYAPLPKRGDMVEAMNRAGEYVCMGRVEKIANPAKYDHTPVVTIAIEKQFADEVRTMKRANAPRIPAAPSSAKANTGLPDDVLVCRCEEVTAGEIRACIRKHAATTVTEVKRRTRAGMGLCQGRTCSKLVMRILQEELGAKGSELEPATSRPPVRPITFGELANGGTEDE